MPSGWHLKSVRHEGRELAHDPFTLDPAFLEALVGASARVTVRDGLRTVQDLKIR